MCFRTRGSFTQSTRVYSTFKCILDNLPHLIVISPLWFSTLQLFYLSKLTVEKLCCFSTFESSHDSVLLLRMLGFLISYYSFFISFLVSYFWFYHYPIIHTYMYVHTYILHSDAHTNALSNYANFFSFV